MTRSAWIIVLASCCSSEAAKRDSKSNRLNNLLGLPATSTPRDRSFRPEHLPLWASQLRRTLGFSGFAVPLRSYSTSFVETYRNGVSGLKACRHDQVEKLANQRGVAPTIRLASMPLSSALLSFLCKLSASLRSLSKAGLRAHGSEICQPVLLWYPRPLP